jgi:signal transduction histidine kinase
MTRETQATHRENHFLGDEVRFVFKSRSDQHKACVWRRPSVCPDRVVKGVVLVMHASAIVDSVRLNFTRLVAHETRQRGVGRIWHRRVASLSQCLKWAIVIVSIGLLGIADYAVGSAESFSVLYLAPIVFATWFIRLEAGAVAAILSVLVGLLVEFTLVGGHSIAPLHVFAGAVRSALIIAGIWLLDLAKKAARRQSLALIWRTRSLRVEVERGRRLEQEIVNASAREQLRLAQDLHDGIGQYVSALTFLSRMLADDLHLHGSAQAALADRIVALVRRTNQVTRQVNRTLQIPDTNGEGLSVALQSLAADVEELTGVHCEISTDQAVPRLDEFRTLMLFRIAQEAFNNCVKHARPHSIRVSLTIVKEVLILVVMNDGHSAGSSRPGEPGSGSLLMKLRAELIGAQLEAGPVTADEYRVRCVLPLPRSQAHGVAR